MPSLLVCDTHVHAFAARPGAVAPASFDRYLQVAAGLGIRRHVIVHSKAGQADPSTVLDAIAAVGQDAARGVLWDEPRRTDLDFERLHKRGIRGIRTLYPRGTAPDVEHLRAIAERISHLGWHLLVQAEADAWPALVDALLRLPCPVLIDHMGRLPAEVAPGDRRMEALLRFVRSGGWLKVSAPYYGTRDGEPGFGSIAWRVRAFVEAGLHRLLWATNWPHLNMAALPDEGRSLQSLLDVLESPAEVRALLQDNAARLYGFRVQAPSDGAAHGCP